jgi:dihydrolipoamide dehydrogenase
MDYDLIIIGSGPGGYVAAIRAAQLKMKVAVVEKAELGGICLNWGCIPTKSLLKSAQVFEYLAHAADYGISVSGDIKPDFKAIIARSRNVAEGMSKGIQFLFRKNNITHIKGYGRLVSANSVEVEDADGIKTNYTAGNIILATGARSKETPDFKQDGEKIIGYKEAMTLTELPQSMVIVGSGAIGCEFASFFKTIGTEDTLVEFLPNILPNEDIEVSKQIERSFKKVKMKILTDSLVESVDTSGEKCKVTVKTPVEIKIIESDIVLSAIGVTANIEDIGLEKVGVKTENGKIVVDDFYKTNIKGIYAIGDIVHGYELAHVASAEGITCVEKIAGLAIKPLDYDNIPRCVYTNPEIASVGLTEAAANEAGYEIKVGKFPFAASGKAAALGTKEGFVKLIFDAKNDELLGAHMVGANVTEMIAEIVVAKKMKIAANKIIKSVHPHPTMSEAIMEAAAAAYNEVIHI